MKILKLAFDFYIKSSIHIAFAVFSLTQLSVLVLKMPKIDDAVLRFIFCGTIVFYNSMKYFHLKKVFFQSYFNQLILIISVISFLLQVYFFFQIGSSIQIQFFYIGIVVFLYPFFRNINFLKMFFVAFCVTYITAYIPIFENQIFFKCQLLFLICRFLWIFCLLIPFEISDFDLDKKIIQTIPHQLGIQKTKLLGYLLIVLLCFLNFEWKMIVILFLTAVAIYFSNKNISKYFTSFWVESIPIIAYFLFLLKKTIF